MAQLNANALYLSRLQENQKVEAMCNMKIVEIVGDDSVGIIKAEDMKSGEIHDIKADGVLIHVGWEPQTGFLEDIVKLDEGGHILVGTQMQSSELGIFAAGDIRSGSNKQVTLAVGDGTNAAIAAQKYLRETFSL
jgi:thioredoxin reductase (NADPH)